MAGSLPTLLVSRQARHVGVDWTRARSWLGGSPRLGATPWPVSKKRQPLHFVAQIDLAEVAAKAGQTALPAKGALAFFIGQEGAVRFVPEGSVDAPALPPVDTPDLTTYGGSADWPVDIAGKPLFPCWPIDFAALDTGPMPVDPDDDDAHDAYAAAGRAAVERLFVRRQYILTPDLAFAGPPIPDWWRNAVHLADDLAKASRTGQGALALWRAKLEEALPKGGKDLSDAEANVAASEAELAKLHAAQPAFKDYVAEVAVWTAGRDPWALMSAGEMQQLAVYWKRNTEFPKLTGYYGIGGLESLKDKMFKALPASDTSAFAAFPDPVRALINAKRPTRPQWWHSAIQFAASLQRAARRSLREVLKHDLESLERLQKQLDQLRPKGIANVFGRLRAKSEEVVKLEATLISAEAKIAEISRLESMFQGFVQETAAWTQGRDHWAFMTLADIAELAARLKRAADEFEKFTSFFATTRLEDLQSMTLRALASGPDHAYASLPEPVCALINRQYLLPPNCWHQMFGRGVEIQGDSSAMREDGYIMLLQLTYDDMMHWDFGDNGAYQFWISAADLAEQNWASVKMTFECH